MTLASARAAVVRGARDVRLEHRAQPEPGPGDARVRVSACGLCGSDLHLFGLGLYRPGVVPGHEVAGVVDALGPGALGVAVGDTVAVEPLHSCGRCRFCDEGRDAICPEAAFYGVHRDGGMADFLVVPARRCFRAPRELAPVVTALAEPTAVAIHGLRRAGFGADQRVLVLGAGAIGLLVLLAARGLGAREVWISARHPHQAERARRFGAQRVLAESEATAEALAGLPAAARPDVCVETVGGHADTVRAGAAALAPGGTLSVLGLFLRRVELDPFPLFAKEITLAWSNCYVHGRERAEFDDALALLDAERERAAEIVTHPVPLDDVARAFALGADKRAGVLKVSVQP